jgi:hypothetical protein
MRLEAMQGKEASHDEASQGEGGKDKALQGGGASLLCGPVKVHQVVWKDLINSVDLEDKNIRLCRQNKLTVQYLLLLFSPSRVFSVLLYEALGKQRR